MPSTSSDVNDLVLVASVLGWIAFVFWVYAFYAQAWHIFRIKDATGLSLAYILYNIIGYTCYLSYTLAYLGRNREWNDVVFATHGAVFAVIFFLQFVFYPTRPDQRLSLKLALTIVGILLVIVLLLALALFGAIEWTNTDTSFVVLLGFVSSGIQVVKYVPQMVHNYIYKSAAGLSFITITLNFAGGILTLIQCAIMAYTRKAGRWYEEFGDAELVPTPVMACIVIGTAGVFGVQRFILYPNSKPSAEIWDDTILGTHRTMEPLESDGEPPAEESAATHTPMDSRSVRGANGPGGGGSPRREPTEASPLIPGKPVR